MSEKRKTLHTTLFRLSLNSIKDTLVNVYNATIIETRGYGWIRCMGADGTTMSWRQVMPSIWVLEQGGTDEDGEGDMDWIEEVLPDLFDFIQEMMEVIEAAMEYVRGEAKEMDEETLEIVAKAKDAGIGYGRMISKDDSQLYHFDSMTQIEHLCEKHRKDVKWDTNPNDRPNYIGRIMPRIDDALNMSQEHWEEGNKVVQRFIYRLIDQIKLEIVSPERHRSYSSEDGDEVDYDRLRSGEDYWSKRTRIMTDEAPMVQIICDITTPWTVYHEDVLWRGAAAVALTHILESRGYRVLLATAIAGYGSWEDGKFHTTYLTLKQYEEPLDISSCTNAMSAWYLRGLMYHIISIYAFLNDAKVDPYHGIVSAVNDKLTDEVFGQIENRIHIGNVFTFESACNLVVDECNKFTATEK